MLRTIFRLRRNYLVPSPRQAVVFQSHVSRAFIACNIFVIILTLWGTVEFDIDSSNAFWAENCSYSYFESIQDPLRRELSDLNCEIKEINHKVKNMGTSFFTQMQPVLTIVAISTASFGFLFNVIITSYKWASYATYKISTNRVVNEFSGEVIITNENEGYLSISKAYFLDNSQRQSVYSEIPITTFDMHDILLLKSGEPLKLRLLPSQAQVARTFPGKIDIVLSSANGKIMCVRCKENWKPKKTITI